MEEKINLLISQLGDLRVKKDGDLKDYLGSRQDGHAKAIYIATSVSELTKAIILCKELKIPFLVIGSGSKIQLSDLIFPGLFIKNRSQNLKIFGVKGKVSRAGIGIKEAFIEADSGVTLSDLADFSFKQGLAGFDSIKQAKGTVGGSIFNSEILIEKVTQIIVLNNLNVEQIKDRHELLSKDVVLRAIFHLKAREV